MHVRVKKIEVLLRHVRNIIARRHFHLIFVGILEDIFARPVYTEPGLLLPAHQPLLPALLTQPLLNIQVLTAQANKVSVKTWFLNHSDVNPD